MAEYDSAIALAQRLINLKGREVDIRRVVDADAPDITKPWAVGEHDDDDDTVQTIKACFFQVPLNQTDGREIVAGDQFMLLAAVDTDFDPEQGDLVSDGSKLLSIVRPPFAVAPGEQVVIWKAVVREWGRRTPE
jgi:hypothetical protein